MTSDHNDIEEKQQLISHQKKKKKMSLSASLIELRKDAGERKGHAFPWTSQITLSAYGVDPKVLKNSRLFSNILR